MISNCKTIWVNNKNDEDTYYDALLSVSDKYSSFVVDDMKKKYGSMLEQGAVTFGETEKGWEDFDGAGSLCHGWSAIPAYYLPKLIK